MQNTDRVWQLVEAHQDDLIGLSDRVWGMPELNFREKRSAAERLGREADVTAAEHTIPGLLTAIEDYYRRAEISA